MKHYTLIQALEIIQTVFMTDITAIEYEDGSGLKFNIKTEFGTYHVVISETGKLNAIVKLS